MGLQPIIFTETVFIEQFIYELTTLATENFVVD
jgi:hypothetical protein